MSIAAKGHRPMVLMVAQRSPKPLVGVQILLGLPVILQVQMCSVAVEKNR